jgi:hypothetical protein
LKGGGNLRVKINFYLIVYILKEFRVYKDPINGAVATLLQNDDLKSKGVAKNEPFRVVRD